VTKFEFEFDNVQISNVSTDSKFNECFKRFVVECEFVEKSSSMTDFICTESQRAQTNLLFSQIQPSHKLQLWNVPHNFGSVTC